MYIENCKKEDYQHLNNIGHILLDSTEEQWPTIPVERIPMVRFGQGLQSVFVAVGHLMLGALDQLRAWFRKSA